MTLKPQHSHGTSLVKHTAKIPLHHRVLLSSTVAHPLNERTPDRRCLPFLPEQRLQCQPFKAHRLLQWHFRLVSRHNLWLCLPACSPICCSPDCHMRTIPACHHHSYGTLDPASLKWRYRAHLQLGLEACLSLHRSNNSNLWDSLPGCSQVRSAYSASQKVNLIAKSPGVYNPGPPRKSPCRPPHLIPS